MQAMVATLLTGPYEHSRTLSLGRPSFRFVFSTGLYEGQAGSDTLIRRSLHDASPFDRLARVRAGSEIHLACGR